MTPLMRPKFDWQLRTRTLALGECTVLMAILNVTPDSFSDGGRYNSLEHAVERAEELMSQGAGILDIGGESTRPGATPVEPLEEQRRVLPVIEELRRRMPQVTLSIDTYHAATARLAVEAGAEIVNDVSGMLWDQRMAATVAELGCGLVLMHTRGTPQQWKTLPPQPIEGLLPRLTEELSGRLDAALAAGIAPECICIDPGFSFGKTAAENLHLLARLDELHELGRPLLAGLSRKGFLRQTLTEAGSEANDAALMQAQAAVHTAAVLAGTHILRVHDVAEARAVCALADRLSERPTDLS